MNTGGDPERDEYGLPRMDVEIPDDARELDRDVQAYYRELRTLRRRRRLHRLGAPLLHDGMVLPLLASCLALTLLTGTLLTMFTSRRLGPSPTVATSAPRLTTPAPGQADQLPDTVVQADSKQVRLRTLRPSALALVPPRCTCGEAARELAAQASQAQVQLYFVTAGATLAEVRALARQPGMAASHLIQDSHAALRSVFRPAGLSVILVYRDGSVRLRRDLRPGIKLEDSLRALAGGSPQGLDLPGDRVLAAPLARL